MNLAEVSEQSPHNTTKQKELNQSEFMNRPEFYVGKELRDGEPSVYNSTESAVIDIRFC